MENYFGIYVIFGTWNQRKWRPTVSNTPCHQRRARRGVMCGAHLVRRLELYFGRKEAYIRKKIVLKS